MPKPGPGTPVDIVIRTLEGIPNWYRTHHAVLALELGAADAQIKRAEGLASQLRQREEKFLQERKEDKDVTTHRLDLIAQLHTFERSVRASVDRRTKSHKHKDRIQSDFQFGPISRVRTTKDANERIRQIRTSLTVHREALNQQQDRTQSWLDQLARFEASFKQNSEDDVREQSETNNVQKLRDEARFDALDFLDDMELAAESIFDQDTLPSESLRGIFDSLNPPAPPSPKTDPSGSSETPSPSAPSEGTDSLTP